MMDGGWNQLLSSMSRPKVYEADCEAIPMFPANPSEAHHSSEKRTHPLCRSTMHAVHAHTQEELLGS